MKQPKAVIFDVGGTLFTDGDFHTFEAIEALRLAADNPDATSTKSLFEISMDLLKRIKQADTNGIDIKLAAIIENVINRAGLEYSTDLESLAILFDSINCSERAIIPNINELLNTLEQEGIRTAVISNTVMSGIQMKAAIERHIPNNNFEFVFTSADFIFKKPYSDIFEAALMKTGLKAEDCWYCGDSFANDVVGSSSVGMYPIHYNASSKKPVEFIEKDNLNYCAVNDWTQLIKIIIEKN
ncbi:MAG TPA: HAD family hydrolase [Clostridia bacterium]|nr:HAD family hydrolase [Clostridia bacterium]